MDEQGFRVPEVTKIVGITYRQLDYWARTDLVTPSIRDASGSGTQRLYSFQDLVTLRVIKNLLDTGVTLMSDGRGVYEADSPEAIVDLLKQGQGVFAIAVDRVWDDVEASLAKRSTPRRRAAAGGA
jgi:hypothetical protein